MTVSHLPILVLLVLSSLMQQHLSGWACELADHREQKHSPQTSSDVSELRDRQQVKIKNKKIFFHMVILLKDCRYTGITKIKI